MTLGEIGDCDARRRLLATLKHMPSDATFGDYQERVRRIRALADETNFPQIRAELLEVAIELELKALAEGSATKRAEARLIVETQR
jgi:hypothetical protein